MKLNWQTFKWLAIVGSLPPLYFHLRALVLKEYVTTNTASDFIFWLVISIFVTIVLSVIVFIEIDWLQKVLPWKKYVARRIIAGVSLTFFTVMVGMLILSKFTYGMHCKMFPEKLTYTHHLFEELTTGMVLWAILVSVNEGVYFFNQWRDELVLSQILQKEKVESQLEALRNQANPHFLFNSLNVLSSLVHSDPDKAEEFINQFASVYRYVLNIQDKNVVTLREELEFLKSYLFLQKIRFVEGLNYKIDIEENLKDSYIVPFSLQMLVENAIKHNSIEKEKPLNIHVFIKEYKVFVKNNIQLREDEVNSNGVGLSNLRQRYFHLAGIMPEISQTDYEFVVNIPLLKPEKKEESIKYDHDDCCNNRRRKFRSRKT
ncbi:MAG: hypothetical protein A2W99_01550 [Bacteroidetes bacterium GWF2_33_16]|nr:MAG: hypothetical protein A2X00_16605 [Bacteroidetes bacterium GWE2_32_14]OFY06956.1 MAG: hypothetical protein A2W99_01550 [Bacteroidetes bacterium GWF2_33_16]